jgi:hypothetical protein
MRSIDVNPTGGSVSTEAARDSSVKAIWRHFVANLRDLWMLLVLGLALSFASDFIVTWAIANGYDKGLATTLDYLRGLSRFAALNFTAMFFGMLGWPTMCHFSAFKWSDGWYAIGIKGQMVAFLGLAGVQIIAAAICFSA